MVFGGSGVKARAAHKWCTVTWCSRFPVGISTVTSASQLPRADLTHPWTRPVTSQLTSSPSSFVHIGTVSSRNASSGAGIIRVRSIRTRRGGLTALRTLGASEPAQLSNIGTNGIGRETALSIGAPRRRLHARAVQVDDSDRGRIVGKVAGGVSQAPRRGQPARVSRVPLDDAERGESA